uniref:Uncharacterized protein n=1 Tax=Anguilla anguilla TaxID=7936 RepID=A0A0E9TDU7_ANGAN
MHYFRMTLHSLPVTTTLRTNRLVKRIATEILWTIKV